MFSDSKKSLDVIFLSNTLNDFIYNMNKRCFDSLFASEIGLDINIILLESNRDTNYSYNYNNIQVIIPLTDFGFNRFINIGLSYCKSDYIAICNNDLIFKKKWFSEIYKLSINQPDIFSFSPIDKKYSSMRRLSRRNKEFHIGWHIKKEIAGWCIVIKKELLSIVNPFDERFDFYFSDNDYGFTLQRNNIKHALVTKSFVHHLEKVVSKEVRKNEELNEFFSFENREKIDYPGYLNNTRYSWILEDDKILKDFLVFYNKWGNPNYLSKVSILIILDNSEKYIKNTIQSALDQTWKNLEIIIVDNYSTDQSYQIAKSYESHIVKVLKTEVKLDFDVVRMYAFDQASGNFIQFLNVGDLMSINKIEEQILRIERLCNDDLIMCSAFSYNIKDNSLINKHIFQKKISAQRLIMNIFLSNYSISLSGFLIHKSLISKLKKFKSDNSLNADLKFILSLLITSKGLYFLKEGNIHCKKTSLIRPHILNLRKKFSTLLSAISR